MIRLFRWLIFGDAHPHKWKIIQENECSGGLGGRWTRRYCQCEICGKIRVFDV